MVEPLQQLLSLFSGIDTLKRLPRSGWVLHGVKNSESVGDHSFGVAAMALYIGRRRGMDLAKLLTMAILHEVCEIKVGDLTPHDKVPPEKKRELETNAAREFLAGIDESGELFELWLDFNERRTPEGSLINDLDRLEMFLQARAYEGQSEKPLDEFYGYVLERLQDPELLALARELAVMK